MKNINIEKASSENAEEILELQKLAYVSEAEIIDDFTIPPLQQTLDEILSEFSSHFFLKAVSNDKIIGSVRGYKEKDTCYIGKLIVHPDFQNQGLGTKLLNRAEKHFPGVKRFELFTGHKSLKNLFLYDKNGYNAFDEKRVSKKLTLIFLEKFN